VHPFGKGAIGRAVTRPLYTIAPEQEPCFPRRVPVVSTSHTMIYFFVLTKKHNVSKIKTIRPPYKIVVKTAL
jgi:hypothetical protein